MRPEDLPEQRFFIPGSILRVLVNDEHPLAFGVGPNVDVIFSPERRIQAGSRRW